MMAGTRHMSPNDVPGPAVSDDIVARLYRRSGAEHWSLARERFAAVVRLSAAYRFAGDAPAPDRATLEAYLDGLHLEDLALACACRDGREAAWTHFVRQVQPHVRAAGRALAGPAGEELADTLIADLFGTTTRDGTRRSLLEYFHGRSRLTTWLRTVLAQRHIDRLRVAQREVPLEGPGAADGTDLAGRVPGDPARAAQAAGGSDLQAVRAADRPHLLAAFDQQLARAVDALNAGDRLRLAYYHVHGLTLARIGRLMGEHESSVSRKLDRARRHVREQVERALRAEHGFGDADLRQCYEDAGRHGTIDLTRLFRDSAGPPQDHAVAAFKPQDTP